MGGATYGVRSKPSITAVESPDPEPAVASCSQQLPSPTWPSGSGEVRLPPLAPRRSESGPKTSSSAASTPGQPPPGEGRRRGLTYAKLMVELPLILVSVFVLFSVSVIPFRSPALLSCKSYVCLLLSMFLFSIFLSKLCFLVRLRTVASVPLPVSTNILTLTLLTPVI